MKILAFFASGVLLSIAALAYAVPAAAATACPSCYGFTAIGNGVYVQASMSDERRSAAVAALADARARVKRFYGQLQGAPRILICDTDDCYRPIGGSSRGQAILNWSLILSPRGTNPIIAAHELSHIELHQRIGLMNTWNRVVPQWFDEGLAADISGDPRYLSQTSEGDRCLVEPGNSLPTNRKDWVESARTQSLYARAACRVDRWIHSHGGNASIVRLAGHIAHGENFNTEVR